jgi:hypothetical protein
MFPIMEAATVSPAVPLWRRVTEGIASVRPLDLRTGHWFDRVLTRYLRSRPARPVALDSNAARQAASAAVMHRNAAEAAALGVATAGVSTLAATLATDAPWSGLAALPVAACALAGDMVARAVMHVRMSCALADIWGIRFSPDDPADLARLYALAFDIEEPRDEVYGGRASIERLAGARDGDLGSAIGSKLASESLLRNLPFIGVLTSAVQSWHATMRVGDGVMQYLRFRHAFDDVLTRVAAYGPEAVDILIEGVWFISIADDRVNDTETALLAHLVRMLPRETRWKLTARFVPDENAFIERLSRLPEPAHDDVFHALEVAATMDGLVSSAERNLLLRAAAALGIEVAPDALDRLIAESLEDGPQLMAPAAAPKNAPRSSSLRPREFVSQWIRCARRGFSRSSS